MRNDDRNALGSVFFLVRVTLDDAFLQEPSGGGRGRWLGVDEDEHEDGN